MHKNITQEVQGSEDIENFQTPKPDSYCNNKVITHEG